MAFHNPEAVREVQEARRKPSEESEKEFFKQVENIFGRKLNKNEVEKNLAEAELEELKRQNSSPKHPTARQQVEEDIIRVKMKTHKDKQRETDK